MVQGAAIPVVDLSGLLSGDADQQLRCAKALVAACSRPGSFYVINHGISEEVIKGAFDVSRLFFARPLEEKMAIHASRCPPFRGYVRVQERKRGSGLLVDDPQQGDLKENLDLGPALVPDDPAVRPGNPFYGPNVWPSEPPQFKPVIETYLCALRALSERILHGVELGLGLSVGELARYFDRPLARMKIIHYPPPPTGADLAVPEGVGAHSDYSCFTILAQDDVGGLEIFDSSGKPWPAPPRSQSLFVNMGDQFARWTNGRFWSTVHRVLNVARRDRYSIAYFFHPNYDATISCLEGCSGPGNHAKYAPVTAGVDLLERLQGARDRAEASRDGHTGGA